MRIDEFKDLYHRNHISEEDLEKSLDVLHQYQTFSQTDSIDEADVDHLDRFIRSLFEQQKCDIPSIVTLMRYYRMIKRNDLFIHLTKYTGGLGVIESILERLKKKASPEIYDKIIAAIEIPQLGTHPDDFPEFTKSFVELLQKHLNDRQIEYILAGNNHQIPESAFIEEKVHYEHANSLDDYLKDLHQRKIATLNQHLKDGTVWFEQNITKEVVDFVASSQEILSAVRRGNDLYITKIPYDTKAYLEAENEIEQRYHACHCPFAKESIRNGKTKIPGIWCNCSAGFGKFPFEMVLDQELRIEVLENVLDGDLRCRFRIPLDGVEYK